MATSDYQDLAPRYVRVATALKARIQEGHYQAGDKLSPQHQLAKEYGVAFATLKHALDLLQGEGYIVRKAGMGTYAATPSKYKGSALVVDDNIAFRHTFVQLLSQQRWAGVAVEGGQQALEQLKERDFDLIFMDLKMSKMNGVETMAKIREFNQSTPVVFVTAYPDSDLMERALALGPITVLRKPFSKEDLFHVLNYRITV